MPSVAGTRLPANSSAADTGAPSSMPSGMKNMLAMQWVKEAAEYEAQDKKRKEAIEVRNDADSMVFQTQKALDEAGDKLDANDKAAVEADLNALKALVEGSDAENMTDSQVDEIKAAKEKLMESAQKLFAKLYEAQQAAGAGAAGAGPDMGAGAGADAGAAGANPYGDDVVDGDYKEV